MMKFENQAQGAPKRKRKGHAAWRRLLAMMLALACMMALPGFASPAYSAGDSNLLLDCPLSVHEHGQECYNEDAQLICGEADYVVHTHAEGCWDEQGNLVCQLAEVKEHRHEASCYTQVQTLACNLKAETPHVHTRDCYIRERAELICDNQEHQHDNNCYAWEDVLVCTVGEDDTHTHTEDCYAAAEALICEEQEHLHSNDCYAWEDVLVCTAGDCDTHTHTDDCNVTEEVLSCGELELHTHTPENCYDPDGKLICEETVLYEHVHGDECFHEAEAEETANADTDLIFADGETESEEIGNDDTGIIASGGDVEAEETVDSEVIIGDETITAADDEVEPRDLKEYLKSVDGVFRYQIFLGSDEIYPDGEGHYSLYPSETYQFSMSIYSPYGFLPGVYVCQLPSEIFDPNLVDVEGIEISGEVIANIAGVDTVIGTYSLGKDGLFTITFNEEASRATDVKVNIRFSFKTLDNDEEDSATPAIKKTGQLDLTDGLFHFTISATIPAYNGRSYSQWYIRDQETLDNTFLASRQSLAEADVVIRYDGKRMPLKNVTEAGEEDMIAYYCDPNTDYLYLVNRKEDGCSESLKDQFHLDYGEEWCTHWSFAEDVNLLITYATKEFNGESILESGADGYTNLAFLFDANESYARPRAEAKIDLPIPKLIEKYMDSSFDENGIGSYTIVINEDKVNLNEYVDAENRITIVDEMEGMVFIPGTLVITKITEGNSTPLIYGTDYTYEWEGENNADGKRVLTIYLSQPGAHMYTIQYDVMIDFDLGESGIIAYKNKASLHFPNNDVSSEPKGGTFGESDSSGVGVSITIRKIDARDEARDENEQTMLSGAVYGLYSADGYEITTGTTGEDGTYRFHTSLVDGIVLAPRVVYYLKELAAPDGYELDPNKYYFYFSDAGDQEIEEQYPGIVRLPAGGIMTLSDTPNPAFELPLAGGIGTLPFYLLGGLLLSGAVLYLGRTSRKKRTSNS